MAYDSQFVICVLHKGSPVREINGKVHVPFGSEYKIRLKNKHSYLRAKARVWIDGRQVSNLGDFILQPGQTLDLERFLDSSLAQGNCFKFVPLSDGRVNDPTDYENGTIKVEFYREYDFKINWPKAVSPINLYAGNGSTGAPNWTFPSTSSWTINEGFDTLTFNSQLLGSSNISCNASVNFLVEATPANGATVEGNLSNQQFVQGADFTTDLFPTTLTLQIRGIENKVQQSVTVPNQEKKVRFCSNCGKRRSRRSDKFCGRCGNTF